MANPNIVVRSASQEGNTPKIPLIDSLATPTVMVYDHNADHEETAQHLDNGIIRTFPPLTLTVEDLIWELNISRPTAYALVKVKGFPSFTIGRRVLVNREKLQEWLNKQCEERG